jgi:prepilin-type N-terminal cleavage/methylation domain-containing protein
MMRKENNIFITARGFTLIELVMVIVIIGILSVVALPKFYDLQSQSKEKIEQATVGAVKSGIYAYYAQSQVQARTPLYPSALDSASDGAVSNTNMFFTNVLSTSQISNWSKSGFSYLGPTGTAYTYNPATGAFDNNGSVPGGGGGT